MTILSIRKALAELNERGQLISRGLLYAAVKAGEIEAVRIGRRLYITDLDMQLKERAREQTAKRRQSVHPRPVVVSQAPRRFGTGRKAS